MKYEDKLQEKIAKEYGLDKLITNHEEDNKLFNKNTKEWYFKQMDKFLDALRERNGTTVY
jgi:mevalonate pyrophosphate decarboxylase